MVPYARQILHATASDEDHRMLLKVVPHTWDISCHLDAVRETDSRNLPQGRIGLFGRRSVNSDADTPLLRTIPQGRSRCFPLHRSPSMAD